jgi:hypothetical protein
MDRKDLTDIPWGRAICYSGYRKGQSPGLNIHPTKEQVVEDFG